MNKLISTMIMNSKLLRDANKKKTDEEEETCRILKKEFQVSIKQAYKDGVFSYIDSKLIELSQNRPDGFVLMYPNVYNPNHFPSFINDLFGRYDMQSGFHAAYRHVIQCMFDRLNEKGIDYSRFNFDESLVKEIWIQSVMINVLYLDGLSVMMLDSSRNADQYALVWDLKSYENYVLMSYRAVKPCIPLEEIAKLDFTKDTLLPCYMKK